MGTEHRLERRAILLGQKMRQAADALAAQLGQGERPPFTTAMTASESMAWWSQHRHDEYGQQVLERMPPWEIARLDADLGAYVNGEGPGRPATAMPAPEVTGGQ